MKDGNEPITELNELEFVKGEILANVWQTYRIARISPVDGKVLGWIDLSGILPKSEHPEPDAVLNGIAYDAADIFAVLPAIRRLTGQALQLEQFGELRGNFGALLLLLFLTWVFGAVVEEMAYRGYALNRIADLFGRSKAAFALSTIAVSVLFGFAHMKQGISGVIDNIAAGLVFTGLYFVSGRNLWLPVIVHGVVDTTSLVFLYFGLAPKGY